MKNIIVLLDVQKLNLKCSVTAVTRKYFVLLNRYYYVIYLIKFIQRFIHCHNTKQFVIVFCPYMRSFFYSSFAIWRKNKHMSKLGLMTEMCKIYNVSDHIWSMTHFYYLHKETIFAVYHVCLPTPFTCLFLSLLTSYYWMCFQKACCLMSKLTKCAFERKSKS